MRARTLVRCAFVWFCLPGCNDVPIAPMQHTECRLSTQLYNGAEGGGTSRSAVGPQSPWLYGGADAAPAACGDRDANAPVDLYLSADDSNSMASPVIARHIIQQRAGLVPAEVLRTYEFLNYYNVRYAPPPAGVLNVVAQARPEGVTDVELQVGVQSWLAPRPRRPLILTLLLDTSGSMGGDPMVLEAAVVRAIAASLTIGDVVNAVTWSETNSVVLSNHAVSGPQDPILMTVADELHADGGTDLHAGLVAGYAMADEHYGSDRMNRVVLISDGLANVGTTDQDFIGGKAKDAEREGIYLVGVGVGDGINDTLMDAVTDAGRGAYVFIDSEDEAEKMFGPRFDEVVDVAARAVQVQLRLPWYFDMVAFHGEEYATEPSEVTPQHLAPGEAMVFHQLIRACDASAIDLRDPLSVTARWVEPSTSAPREVSMTTTLAALFDGGDQQLRRGRAIVAYAEALRAIPSLVPSEQQAVIDDAIAAVQLADPDASDPALEEIESLLDQYRTAPGM